MHIPRATYRVQLHKEFNFQDLKTIIPYLDRLGISTIYAAPFFKATPGSMHGYDVLDPLMINPEIGTLAELLEIRKELKARNMSWLQDIVPNHMAFSSLNPWIYDILEKGPLSKYYRFFDVDWEYPEEAFYAKLMVPTLGSSLEEALHEKQIQLKCGDNGFYLAYYDHSFPVSVQTWISLINQITERLKAQQISTSILSGYLAVAEKFKEISESVEDGDLDNASWDTAKQTFITQSKVEEVQLALTFLLDEINETDTLLQNLLSAQYFRLTHWKTTEKKINYRRFFTVNDLICLNMQEVEVFDTYHQFIKQLIDEDLIQGVRVDHIDGLLDPTTYLERLRQLVGDQAYILVEKILEVEEKMPSFWPISGSSGYDYLALSNQLFNYSEGAQKLLQQYQQNINDITYESTVFKNKHFILQHRMAGELDNLYHLLQKLDIIPPDELTNEEIKYKAALGQLLVAFPVYRVYARQFPFPVYDTELISHSFDTAESNAPELKPYLQKLRKVFNGINVDGEQKSADKLYFNMRSQQFTGPLAAKGVEDTTFYQYFPLISHNEVGDSPEHLGISVQAFHQQMKNRSLQTMNTTSTHDTKRGEDARMRINVISEIPSLWNAKVDAWSKMNTAYFSTHSAEKFPDKNDAYFLYQTLLGTYPLHIAPAEDDYLPRLQDYLLKALREAKVHTNWAEPNEAYEKAFLDFASQILEDQDFVKDFSAFALDIVQTASVYSIGQILLKLTVAGVPDIYQGTEFWDLSMVDPDNRRAVNYPDRDAFLKTLEDINDDQEQLSDLLSSLNTNPLEPNIKLFTMYHTLKVRKHFSTLFSQGEYHEVSVSPAYQEHLIAFKRITNQEEALMLIPLNIHVNHENYLLPLGSTFWKDCEIILEDGFGTWKNHFTNQTIHLQGNTKVADILTDFPLALLTKN